MYRELINHFASHINFAIPQSPVGETEIRGAEKKLQVSFPDELKTILLEMNGDEFLLCSLNWIVEENLRLKQNHYFSSDTTCDYLFFATNGCGDHYGYRILLGEVQAGSIVMWEHELSRAKPVANNISELIELYYTDII